MRTLHEAVDRCRTLVVEGPDGIARSGLLAELVRNGFTIRRSRDQLHHVDPTRPYRELLAAPGRLAVDGGIVHELVYGPLRRGHSRVTWIQALDFAESVAERDGALFHLTDSGRRPDTEVADAYRRVFRTLSQHVPVVTLDIGGPGPPIRAPSAPDLQLGRCKGQLTVGWKQTA
ncbi:hypothetical protein O3Q52_29950 [Streptomyces sp. ActVer]|uniref:hypothetical protein n=1 Tax=Streptomyces sp. ActVer TaxID=3014558 RepID=UPI0022B5BBBF|nr:hypothetical protein [Streptomyces sp. ActVer]MCZ4512316.1 hypothetical protein [Streptomyces sp. ActVer]